LRHPPPQFWEFLARDAGRGSPDGSRSWRSDAARDESVRGGSAHGTDGDPRGAVRFDGPVPVTGASVSWRSGVLGAFVCRPADSVTLWRTLRGNAAARAERRPRRTDDGRSLRSDGGPSRLAVPGAAGPITGVRLPAGSSAGGHSSAFLRTL